MDLADLETFITPSANEENGRTDRFLEVLVIFRRLIGPGLTEIKVGVH